MVSSTSYRLKSQFIITIIIFSFIFNSGFFWNKKKDKDTNAKQSSQVQTLPEPIPDAAVAPTPAQTPTAPPAEAEIQELSERQKASFGNWAQGFYGDYLLSNGNLRVTISNEKQSNNLFPSGGFILDVSNNDLPIDYLGFLNVVAETPNDRKVVYTKSEIKNEGYPNSAKALILSGHVSSLDDLLVKTEYIIEPDTDYIKIITTFINNTEFNLEGFNAHDNINWGALSIFIPGVGFVQMKDNLQADWIAGFIDDTSILIGTSSQDIPLTIDKSQTETNVNYREAAKSFKKGETFKIERYLFVGDADTAGLAAELYQIKGKPLGMATGTMQEHPTNNILPNTDILVIVNKSESGEYTESRPFLKTRTDDRGRFSLRLPQGSYFIRSNPFGRLRPVKTLSVDVIPNRTTVFELKASEPIYLDYEVVDADSGQPLACKLTFINIRPTTYPNFGPPYNSDGARHTVYSPTGIGKVAVQPGFYGVFVSHGIEYGISKNELEIKANQENKLQVKLKKEVPVDGFVSMDIGVKTNNSWNTPVTQRDRVISAAAEGVDVVVTGDVNIATDLSPIVKQLNLDSQLKAVTGMRIEYDRKDPIGNFLVFPVPPGSNADSLAQATNGEQLFKAIRSTYPKALISVMKPLFPIEGYFDIAGFDKETGEIENSSGFSYDFDLLDLWEGKRLGAVDPTNELYILLGYKNVVPGIIGGSNSQTIFGEEVGYPRVFVQSSNDDPAKIDFNEIEKNLKAGKVFITNGPIIDFKVNGKGFGEVVTVTDPKGIVDCELIVRAPKWVQTDFIDVISNGIFRKRIIRRSYDVNQHYPKPGTEGAGNFRLRATQDCVFQIKVIGDRSLEPIVTKYGTGDEEYVRAMALSGPIFIDADGDGKCTLTDISKRGE